MTREELLTRLYAWKQKTPLLNEAKELIEECIAQLSFEPVEEGLVEILRRIADLLPEIMQKVIENLPELMEKNAWTEERAIDFLHSTGWMQRHDEEMTRPHGEWILHLDDLFPEESTEECSVCHEEQRITGNDDNFCPSCGADMREEGQRFADGFCDGLQSMREGEAE